MKIIAALLLAAALTLPAGCTKNSAMEPDDTARGINESYEQVKVKQTAPDTGKNKSNAQIARRLEKLATGVPDVKGANCVVFGNMAVVGINIDKRTDRAKAGSIKYAVAKALSKDRYGAKAIVTADADMTQRLRELGTDIRRGRPIRGFAQEMSDIIGRIIPQVPNNTHPAKERQSQSGEAGELPQQQPGAGTTHQKQAPSNGQSSTSIGTPQR